MLDPQVGLLITNVPRSEWYAAVSSTPQIIGRNANADIKTPQSHRTVSRNHAKIWSNHMGAWIADLKSTCGTRVNGLGIPRESDARIVIGDRICLGKLELTLIDNEDSSGFINPVVRPAESRQETLSFKPPELPATNPEIDLCATLSNAERQVLLWVSRGYTTPSEIGEQLKRSPHTVRTQLNSIFKKLGVHSRDELVGYLLRNK